MHDPTTIISTGDAVLDLHSLCEDIKSGYRPSDRFLVAYLEHCVDLITEEAQATDERRVQAKRIINNFMRI